MAMMAMMVYDGDYDGDDDDEVDDDNENAGPNGDDESMIVMMLVLWHGSTELYNRRCSSSMKHTTTCADAFQ